MSGGQIRVVAVAAVVLSGLAACKEPPPPPPPPDPGVRLSSYDDFNRDLATRIARVLGSGATPDFQVVATPVSDPIGTLYRKGRSVAVDDSSCRPGTNPDARSMPNAFPSYSFGSTLAGELGIDSGVVQAVANAGASLSNEASFSFAVASARLQALSEKALQDVVATQACRAAILKDMVLVRGYVTGQRSFSTTGKVAAGASAGVTKIGSLNISVSANGAVTISDDEPQAFLQVITEVVPSATVSAPVKFSAPMQVAGTGRIYIQQDRSDDPRKGSELARTLQSAGFKNVSPQVEKTAAGRTPNTAQVRYFNDADKAKALELLRKLQAQYPDAKLVSMKLPAPPGQLEVWLPRVK